MRIDITKLKVHDDNNHSTLKLYVYGAPNEEVSKWIEYHGLLTEEVNSIYTNIIVPDNIDISTIFEIPKHLSI